MKQNKITGYLKQAAETLSKHPKLFLPKILLAGLFGIGMLLTAETAKNLPLIEGMTLEQQKQSLAIASMLLAYTLFLIIADVFVNAMYPTLVKQAKNREKISFRQALRKALQRTKTVLPANLAILAGFTTITIPLNLAFIFFLKAGNTWGMIAAAAMIAIILFLAAIGFYWIYPITVMEKTGTVSSLKTAMTLSKKNLKNVSIASIFPFIVSTANFALAFFAENPAAFWAFVLMRLATSIVYTYHMVLNPEMYFELEEKK